MALNRSNKYPGRFLAPTAARPQGAFKNRTSPTAQDGSYLEADWANDWDGFFARILTIANVTPNGTVDSGTASQLYDALMTATPGRLIANPKLITTATTYIPSAGTNKIIVEIVGGGAAGGGATAGTATNNSAGGGGGGGAYARILITAVPSSVSCSVGSGGAGLTGAPGQDGASSSFGSYVVCPGGLGGGTNSGSNAPVISGGGLLTPAPTISNALTLVSTPGEAGTPGLMLTGQGGFGGNGGGSPFGSGARGTGLGFGPPGGGNGSGGGGALNLAQTSVARPGGNGAAGLIIVWEYS